MNFVLPSSGARRPIHLLSFILRGNCNTSIIITHPVVGIPRRGLRSRVQQAALMELQKQWTASDYAKWSHSDLIARVQELEVSLKEYTRKEIK